jgi:PilZ domain
VEKSVWPASKCYLTPEGRGLISCPCCGFGKTVDFKNAIPVNRNVRIRCKCGEIFGGFLEIRQHYRKKVKFSGRYTNLTSLKSGKLTVENISRMGIGFRVMGFEYFEEEDLVKVTFELDNCKKSRILANGSIKYIQGNFVGCRIHQIREGEKEFGFYLMP